MDDLNIIASMEPLIIYYHKHHYAILNIYILLVTIHYVIMLNT